MKTPNEYSGIALQNFESGMNCAQAVLCAFEDETGLDRSTACKMSSSFGGGMGHLGEVCGTLTATFMAAGMIYGYGEPNALAKDEPHSSAEFKAAHYQRIQKITKPFSNIHGTYLCRELLARPSHDGRTSCAELVADATKIFARMLVEDGVVEAMSST